MLQTNLDTDILRTLVTAQQLGGFNRAAQQVGRSQSAVSQQIRRLEEQLGQPLFRKEGRSLALTEAGDVVFSYARRILDLNDEAVAAVRGVAIDGKVRFGLPTDFAESWLPTALGRFKRAHPGVRVEVNTERRAVLIDRLDKGQLDLALLFGGSARSDALRLAKFPMVWIGSSWERPEWRSGQPLPLALFNPPCFFRETAIAALDRAGIPWHIAFTSPSLHGIWAAVDAGLGITVRTATGLPNQLIVLDKKSGFPPLPMIDVSLHDGGRQLTPAAARFKEVLLETLAVNLPTSQKAKRKSS
ncbi:MAG TPA: LysR substrate-binding domain-containing protein [Chthoniobacterales bacterium]|nr:LysR substrate-binding domain-containing protein [Chthoniobacterales bacterium]